MLILCEDAVVTCAHELGRVSIVPGQEWVRIAGRRVLIEADPEGRPIRFAHAFVDEVQDASPVELRVLLELTGKERCITLAGDVAQRMLDDGDDRGEFDWNALLDGLGVPHTKIEPLMPALNSYWLKIHVTLAITASGVLMIGFCAAALHLVRAILMAEFFSESIQTQFLRPGTWTVVASQNSWPSEGY